MRCREAVGGGGALWCARLRLRRTSYAGRTAAILGTSSSRTTTTSFFKDSMKCCVQFSSPPPAAYTSGGPLVQYITTGGVLLQACTAPLIQSRSSRAQCSVRSSSVIRSW
jgi:hypothetical protein